MKPRKTHWIVKVPYITEDYQYAVKYINVPYSTKEEVLRYAQSLHGCSSVNVYSLMKYCNYELAPRADFVHLSTGLLLIILLTI